MHFKEVDFGNYRIYAGAIERTRAYGYVAAVVVMRLEQGRPRQEVFRDENMAGGYGWPSPAEALRHAVKEGQRAVSTKSLQRPYGMLVA
ncbi:hypothetical protein QRD43_10720 [Pelomonas sp. APW6]|uniref:Uncharacterized protein n=1 Tax=Roseateles subflavus TaxID=3053353 RepID=A0ABT7LHN1_9BURK|nr:hypothetical protein [Pelomonas sp. APW6]MDL5032374.1 hypothetical protein [Pelomonas sp. APW6]